MEGADYCHLPYGKNAIEVQPCCFVLGDWKQRRTVLILPVFCFVPRFTVHVLSRTRLSLLKGGLIRLPSDTYQPFSNRVLAAAPAQKFMIYLH